MGISITRLTELALPVFFEAFPLVFIDIYHFSFGVSGLAFSGILVGAVVSYAVYAGTNHSQAVSSSHCTHPRSLCSLLALVLDAQVEPSGLARSRGEASGCIDLWDIYPRGSSHLW